MKPIRSKQNLHVVHEPWEFKEVAFQQDDAADVVSDACGLESRVVSRQAAFDCGCLNRPQGGFCADCVSEGARGLICESCFGHCPCGRPICRRHSELIDRVDGKALRLCRPCYEAAKRKQIVRGIVRSILSPFVRSNEDR